MPEAMIKVKAARVNLDLQFLSKIQTSSKAIKTDRLNGLNKLMPMLMEF